MSADFIPDDTIESNPSDDGSKVIFRNVSGLLLYTIILLYDDDDNDDDDDDAADDANDNDDETTTIMIICNMLFHMHFL